jgi:hypothetical protein
VFLAISLALCGYVVPQPKLMTPVSYLSYLVPLYWYLQSSFVIMFKDQHIYCEHESEGSQNPLLCMNSVGNVILRSVHADGHNYVGTITSCALTSYFCFYFPHCYYNPESWPRKLWVMLRKFGTKYHKIEDSQNKNFVTSQKLTCRTGLEPQKSRISFYPRKVDISSISFAQTNNLFVT